MKKFIIRVLWIVGMSIFLISVFAGVLILQKNLTISRVQASPGPDCTVNDTFRVKGPGGSNTFIDIVANPADTSTDSWNGQLRFFNSAGALLHVIRGGSPNSPLVITPGYDGQAPNKLKVDGFTESKLVAPQSWNFTSWNTAGETANFTLDTTYPYALVSIQIDAQTNWGEIIFYDGAGGTGNAVASTQWFVGRWDWKQGLMEVVLVPTNAKSVKIMDRGGGGSEQNNINMVVITYVP